MAQEGKTQQLLMEEILASIRRTMAENANQSAPAPMEPTRVESVPPSSSFLRTAQHQSPSVSKDSDSDAGVGEFPLRHSRSHRLDDVTDTAISGYPAVALSRKPDLAPRDHAPDSNSEARSERENEQVSMPTFAQGSVLGGNERSQFISSEVSAAIDPTSNALAQTVLVNDFRTLENLLREMLRPMLKSWLDDNLTNVVERLVRAEIERRR
jgi:cell pole-organizing protein PopZ